MSTQLKVLAVWALLVFGANIVPSQSEALSLTPNTVPVELKVDLKQSSVTKPEVCYANVQCRKLAEAVFFEGRGEPVKGQYAIAYTIINRRDSGKYADDVHGVVNQKRRGICQFSYMCQINAKGRRTAIGNDDQSWQKALDVAYNTYFYEAVDPTKGGEFFHTKKVKPIWRHQLQPALALGNHIFYRS
jgi:spore germination cell wall hydrolase CwlJ-like protein